MRVHGSICRHYVINVLPPDYGDSHDEEGRERLERHFARLGAHRLPAPGYLFMDLEARHPVLESGEFLPEGTEVEMFDISAWYD